MVAALIGSKDIKALLLYQLNTMLHSRKHKVHKVSDFFFFISFWSILITVHAVLLQQ